MCIIVNPSIEDSIPFACCKYCSTKIIFEDFNMLNICLDCLVKMEEENIY